MDLAVDWKGSNAIVVHPKHDPVLANLKLDDDRVKIGKRLRDIAQQKIDDLDIDPMDKLQEQSNE